MRCASSHQGQAETKRSLERAIRSWAAEDKDVAAVDTRRGRLHSKNAGRGRRGASTGVASSCLPILGISRPAHRHGSQPCVDPSIGAGRTSATGLKSERTLPKKVIFDRLPRCALALLALGDTEKGRKMGYRLAPVEVNPAEGGFAEFRICNEFDEPITTFGFADEHEARIARALMIRAIKNAVLIISHASVARRKDQ